MHIGVMVNGGIPDISKSTVLDRTFTSQELCGNHLRVRLRSNQTMVGDDGAIYLKQVLNPIHEIPPIFNELHCIQYVGHKDGSPSYNSIHPSS